MSQFIQEQRKASPDLYFVDGRLRFGKRIKEGNNTIDFGTSYLSLKDWAVIGSKFAGLGLAVATLIKLIV